MVCIQSYPLRLVIAHGGCPNCITHPPARSAISTRSKELEDIEFGDGLTTRDAVKLSMLTTNCLRDSTTGFRLDFRSLFFVLDITARRGILKSVFSFPYMKCLPGLLRSLCSQQVFFVVFFFLMRRQISVLAYSPDWSCS